MDEDGNFSIRSLPDLNGQIEITYTVSDGVHEVEKKQYINVLPVDDNPIAGDDTVGNSLPFIISGSHSSLISENNDFVTLNNGTLGRVWFEGSQGTQNIIGCVH